MDNVQTAPPVFNVDALIDALVKHGHAVHKHPNRDFLVCKYGMSRYCQDVESLKAFAKQLGVMS